MSSTSYARNTIYTCTVTPVPIPTTVANIIPGILINKTADKEAKPQTQASMESEYDEPEKLGNGQAWKNEN
jgi:hypothetical protein